MEVLYSTEEYGVYKLVPAEFEEPKGLKQYLIGMDEVLDVCTEKDIAGAHLKLTKNGCINSTLVQKVHKWKSCGCSIWE
jgi:hypothetical protein